MKTVCVIVPMYNEEDYAALTIASLLKISKITRVIAVDDCSNDNTWNVIKCIDGIEKIRHSKNLGKAASLEDGVRNFDADIYVFSDADLCESAIEFENLIDEVLNGSCDMCVGRLPENEKSGGIGILRSFAKFGVKTLSGVDFPCPLSGQRVIKKEIVEDKRVRFYRGYGIEVGMLIDAIKSGYNVKYVDTNFRHRVTRRDLTGFLHRFNELCDVAKVFAAEFLRW